MNVSPSYHFFCLGPVTNVRYCAWATSCPGKWAPVVSSFQRHLFGSGPNDDDSTVTLYKPPLGQSTVDEDITLLPVGNQKASDSLDLSICFNMASLDVVCF